MRSIPLPPEGGSPLERRGWLGEDATRVWVSSDAAYRSGNPKRIITFRSEGTQKEKITTVNLLLRNCTPYDTSARDIYGAGNGRMRFDTNFTGTLWRNPQSNKVICVIADVAAPSGNERRRLVVRIVQGDAVGREHMSSPARLHHAYEPVCPRAVQITNGTVVG